MEILALLIPLSILLVSAALWFFSWAVDHDQFEDLDRQDLTTLDTPEDAQS
jgi:cbb3-type cytochrome oxidase maturation protein